MIIKGIRSILIGSLCAIIFCTLLLPCTVSASDDLHYESKYTNPYLDITIDGVKIVEKLSTTFEGHPYVYAYGYVPNLNAMKVRAEGRSDISVPVPYLVFEYCSYSDSFGNIKELLHEKKEPKEGYLYGYITDRMNLLWYDSFWEHGNKIRKDVYVGHEGKWIEGNPDYAEGGLAVIQAKPALRPDISKKTVSFLVLWIHTLYGRDEVLFLEIGDVNTQTATQTASINPGEDAGTSIWTDIVEGIASLIDGITGSGENGGMSTAAKVGVSLGGALATAGALSAASGGKNKGNKDKKEEEKKKTYLMKVYKDFGDAVKRGADPVRVWARIVEIEEGAENIRDDLTANISASGEGMKVRLIGMQNSWQGAEVSVPADSEAQNATLIFTFTGRGGVMHNRITFRVIGEPEIIYPAVSQDGKHWDVNDQNNQVDMIAGIPVVERLRFVISDATEEPKAIRFEADHEGFDITYEKDPQWQYTYYACIENRTAPIEKESGIFASIIPVSVRIEAEFKDRHTIWSLFPIRLFPEGLSVQGTLTDGRLTVNTLPLENPTKGFAKIAPTVFSLMLAFPDRNGHAVVAEEPRWTPRELTDDGKYGLMFKGNFRYNIKYQSASEIALYPENTLPAPNDPYEVYMPIAVDTGWTEGRDYSADLPMLLFGDEFELPSKAKWNAALERLKRSIRFFGINNDPKAKQIILHASDHSAAELENTRYHIVAAGKKFYEEYGEAYQKMDQLFTDYIVIAGSLVKAGDYAIKVLLIKALGKTLGTTAEHIIDPFKNMLFTYIGECIAGTEVSREKLEERFMETLLTGVQDAICETITGDLKAAPENMGYAVAVYLMISFTKHYWGYGGSENAKGDVYKSVLAACGDLALEKFKAWISDLISKGSEKLVKTISNWCGSLFKKSFNGVVQKTIEAAKDKAFEQGMRPLIHRGDVTTAEYLAVKASKEAAAKLQEETMKNFLSFSANNFSKNVLETLDIGLGSVINYYFKGKIEDNSALGLKTKDVIAEFFGDRLGMKVGKIYPTTRLNDISVRFEDDLLKLRLLDWGVEIPVFENMHVFANMIMDFCFSWMEMVWKYSFPSPDQLPDLRDKIEDASQMIEHQKELYDSLKPINYQYFGK